MGTLRWRGILTQVSLLQQRVLLALLAVLCTSLAFTQNSFVGIGPKGDYVTYAFLLLLPIVAASLTLGTLRGTVVGIVAGAVLYAHSAFMPLNFQELALVTPLSSVVLLGLCGLLCGTLLSLVFQRESAHERRVGGMLLVCLVTSAFYSLAFAGNALLLHESGTISGLTGSEFAAVFSSFTAKSDDQVFGLVLQVLFDAGLMFLLSLGILKLVERLVRLADNISLREAFRTSIYLVAAMTFIITATFSFVSITLEKQRASEAAVRSEVNYLCLQLEGIGKRVESFQRVVQTVNINAAELSEEELEDYRMLSNRIGDVIEGYTMEQTGTVAIIADDMLLATDDKRLEVGANIQELLGVDIRSAIHESLQTGEMQRILYGGILATTNLESGEAVDTQIGYLLADQQDGLIVMIIEPSNMFYSDRGSTMFRETIVSFTLLVVVALLVNLLLNTIVARRIDETNAELALITHGDLNVRVRVGGTKEFKSLSSGINQTVDALEGWISEAETRMNNELAAARAIQESALPRTFSPLPGIPNIDIYASMNPAREVGGDFFDFFPVEDRDGNDDGKLAFVIADVSGKGVPASLFMMRAKALIRDSVESGIELGRAIETANHRLCDGNDADMFVTAWIGVIDYKTGIVTWINAGHNPPLLLQDGAWHWLKERSGLPLGVFDGPTYREYSLTCHPGDKFLLYTDGVNEAVDADNALYGEDRIFEVLTANNDRSVHDLVDILHADVLRYAEGVEQADDITLLALELTS